MLNTANHVLPARYRSLRFVVQPVCSYGLLREFDKRTASFRIKAPSCLSSDCRWRTFGNFKTKTTSGTAAQHSFALRKSRRSFIAICHSKLYPHVFWVVAVHNWSASRRFSAINFGDRISKILYQNHDTVLLSTSAKSTGAPLKGYSLQFT